jgi:hypothetical protein
MKTTIKKEYDCVKLVRVERERIARDTEGKSPREITEYFKNRQQKRNKANRENNR